MIGKVLSRRPGLERSSPSWRCSSRSARHPRWPTPLAYVPLGHMDPGGSATGVAIVDVGTGARVGTIPLSVRAFFIAINPAGTRAYVVAENGVDVIDVKTRAVVKTISGVGGGDIAVDPSGTRAYVIWPGRVRRSSTAPCSMGPLMIRSQLGNARRSQ